MDTNQNNGQNYQINAFVKGMNSDTSLDQVSNEQYLFGRNIRITNNALLTQDINSNNKEGIVTPIVVGKSNVLGIPSGYIEILATASIGNIGAIILKKQDDTWDVYKVQLNNDKIEPNLLFSSEETTDKKQLSVVINKEQENLIKLYIADGKNGIMQLFLQHPTEDLSTYYNNKEIDDLVSHKYFPTNKVTITGVIGGQLKTSQIQYTYRLYQKYGVFSKLAPLTNKIQIINNNRNTEEGNAEDTKTSMGLSLQITDNKSIFDHIQVYRIQYVKAGQLPEINLIKDQKFDGSVKIDDTGLASLQQLSLDEFSALDGQDIIPTVIESNQGYLFGANIKDTTIFDLETQIQPLDITYKLVGTKIPFSSHDYNSQSDWRLNNIPTTNGQDNVFFYLNSNANNVHVRPDEFQENLDDLEHSGTGSGGGTSTDTSDNTSTNNTSTTTNNISIDTSDIIKYTEDGIEKIYKYENYLKDCSCVINNVPDKNYNNIFTSSLLRSLRRGETYRYGIIFYNENGQKTNVRWLYDITIPDINNIPIFDKSPNYYYYTISIGVEFKLSDNLINALTQENVKGYEIVRCQKLDEYSKILIQCALARPVNQYVFGDNTNQEQGDSGIPEKRTPYYPMPFISTDLLCVYYNPANYDASNIENNVLYQIYSAETLFERTTTQQRISNNTKLSLLYYALNDSYYSESKYKKESLNNHNERYVKNDGGTPLLYYLSKDSQGSRQIFKITPRSFINEKQEKQNAEVMNFFYDYSSFENEELVIENVKDVKNPLWDSGFTNIQLNGDNSTVSEGIKAYQSYNTTISNFEYVNWIAQGKYGLAIYKNEATNQVNAWFKTTRDYEGEAHDLNSKYSREYTDAELRLTKKTLLGWIGAGPVCQLIKIQNPHNNSELYNGVPNEIKTPRSILANITHEMKLFAGEEDEDKQYDVYYGFGNYRGINNNKCIIFDGNIYDVPCEFTSMFKAWDFRSIDDYIESTQFVNYIPMETKINTFFDYGMNYRNTQNKNLQLEPGTISGITTQDRPLHQYNPIYSDNDTSVSVYYAQPLEKTQNIYPHRIVYSQQKTNGENIDNWNIFKPIDFVDADTRYGEITELMTVNDILYFWQNTAFGKLSVNERSLVVDENSNTIQLGQGGVLQRTDYISTKYGMRPEDYSAIEAEGGVYWIDILNKAIVAYLQGRVINYGEYTNVQNIINNCISEEIPQIDYDLQNMELLCKCLKEGNQLVFSTKLGCATSIYERTYDKLITFANIIYALDIYGNYDKLNYLSEEEIYNYLNTELKFVINSNPSQTKVFDNQKLVTLKKNYNKDFTKQAIEYTFETDLNNEVTEFDLGKDLSWSTDREGNICYTIPREEHNDSTIGRPMPLRLRGKWMTVNIKNEQPQQDFAISHVITKFRQSYS